jgi:hypothetical protein
MIYSLIDRSIGRKSCLALATLSTPLFGEEVTVLFLEGGEQEFLFYFTVFTAN